MAGEFTLYRSPPDAETLALARKELRETPENVQQGLAELREFLKNDDEIYFKDDDEYLTIFLRPCKWYAKSAYELIKRIADFKAEHKTILEDLLPANLKLAFTEHNTVNIMKNLDHKGRRVLIVNIGDNWDPSQIGSEQIFRIFYLIYQTAVIEPSTQINGGVVIMDFKGMTMKQVRGLGPSFARLLLTFIQEAMPLRLKEIHMVKQPMVFNIVWTLFKTFLKAKLKSRIFFHGNKMASLHKHIPPSHLPKDYDGLLPAIDYSGKDWYPVIDNEEIIEYYKLMNSFGKKK